MPSFRRRPESSGFKTKGIFILLDSGLRRNDVVVLFFHDVASFHLMAKCLLTPFHAFASWAKDAHPCITHFVDEKRFLGSLFLPLPIHPAVLHRLCDMLRKNIFAVRQIGDGTRYLEHAVVSARRQVEAGDGLLQQCGALRIRRA